MDAAKQLIPFPLRAMHRKRDPVLHPHPEAEGLGILCLHAAANDPALSAVVRTQAAALCDLLAQARQPPERTVSST